MLCSAGGVHLLLRCMLQQVHRISGAQARPAGCGRGRLRCCRCAPPKLRALAWPENVQVRNASLAPLRSGRSGACVLQNGHIVHDWWRLRGRSAARQAARPSQRPAQRRSRPRPRSPIQTSRLLAPPACRCRLNTAMLQPWQELSLALECTSSVLSRDRTATRLVDLLSARPSTCDGSPASAGRSLGAYAERRRRLLHAGEHNSAPPSTGSVAPRGQRRWARLSAGCELLCAGERAGAQVAGARPSEPTCSLPGHGSGARLASRCSTATRRPREAWRMHERSLLTARRAVRPPRR
jgi:hypothetical protein